jgi:hypothetical protein
MRRVSAFVLVVSIGLVAGCGGSDPHNRQAVSGTVKYKGKDIVYGNIEFAPNENQNTPLTLEIRDGKYSVAQKGGLSPGKYTVRISGYDAAPPPAPDVPGNPTGPQPKEIVPAKYNSQSKESITVKVGEKNEFPFDLN